MAESPAAQSAIVQDAAASRLAAAWQLAVSSARSGSGGADAPDAVRESVQLAVIAALVAAYAALRRRGKPVSTSALTVGEGPVRDRSFPARPGQDMIEKQAEELTEKFSPAVWRAATEHVKANPPETDGSFARRAVHTSAAAVASEAQLAFAADLGMVWKVWISRADGRVRPLHRELHGKPVRLGEPFWSGPTGKLHYPGDPTAPLDTIINCRCTMFLAATRAGIIEALAPADLDRSFALAASLERERDDWT